MLRLPPHAVTRFAPSPTGELHLGHVANIVWVWGVAQATGARVLLRIEDHDRGRSRPEYESRILADLEWLGVAPDDDRPLYRQSDHPDRYEQALARLATRAPVYACRCSRRAIAEAPDARADPESAERRYPGTCRDLGLERTPTRGLRVVLPDESIRFTDLRLGPMVQIPARQCGDLLVRDPAGHWTYQFSVTVDDQADAVDLVIRGEDLLESTGRQISLGRLLDRPAPASFLHHPLIRDEAGVKLSKRNRSAGLAALRAEGWTPERVLGLAAHRTGLAPAARPIGAGELGGLFGR